MATRYGGKRLDIIIDGGDLGDPLAARTYEFEVVRQLREVLDVYGGGKYETGRWVMEELTKKLTIRPSMAQKHDAMGQGVLDPQSHPVMIPSPNASAEPTDPDKSVAPARIFGVRGIGSDVVIRYSPSIWWYLDARRIGFDRNKHRYVQLAPDERYYLSADKLSVQPDDILLHEMFHAYRQMNGLWLDTKQNTFDADYGKKEEFFAVLVTNIYVSERNTTYQPRALRGKYVARTDGTQPLFRDLENDPQFQDPKTRRFSTQQFFDRYKDAIGEMIGDMSNQFKNRLALVKAEFNPIAQYLKKYPNA